MLDKSKKFSVFVGCNAIGAKYQQGNKIYNAQEQEISWEDGSLINAKDDKKERRPVKSVKA